MLQDSLQDIENQVRVPEWFTNKVDFCFEFDAWGNKAQCNGMDGTKFCAPPNRMTQPYHDMTDTRDGGCGMKWSLFGGKELPWFKSTKILFRWYSVWSPCACGGRDGKDDVPFILSAAPNSWTQEYFDDTSETHGECIMQWMLQVPDTAPAWAQNIHLCFDFSCGNIKDCVAANVWTPPYMDNSSASTPCSMSWGLQIY